MLHIDKINLFQLEKWGHTELEQNHVRCKEHLFGLMCFSLSLSLSLSLFVCVCVCVYVRVGWTIKYNES